MNLLRAAVVVSVVSFATWVAWVRGDLPPPIDDSASFGCPANRVAFCSSFCAHNPNPSCYAFCCAE